MFGLHSTSVYNAKSSLVYKYFSKDYITVMVQFYFMNGSYTSLGSNVSTFTSTLLTTISTYTGPAPFGTISAQVNSTSTGSIFVSVFLPSLALQTNLATAVSAGQILFMFGGSVYTASFSANYGLCPLGSVSATSYAPGCFTCPANTYVWLTHVIVSVSVSPYSFFLLFFLCVIIFL